MASRSREIGWNEQSILLYEISKKLDLLIKIRSRFNPIVLTWILATGFWVDSSTWIDTDTWND